MSEGRRRHVAERVWEKHPMNVIHPINVSHKERVRVLWRPNVAIVGASQFRNQAPLNDPDWEVWSLNNVPVTDGEGRLRADRWFDLHQRTAQSALDLKWIRECPVPIYVPDDLANEGPRAVRFPVEQIEMAFRVSYWTCTFAYQIALAIHMGARSIGLYGVELLWGTPREATVEYACTSYWVGQAEARGVRVVRPAGSRVAQHVARYGLEYHEEKNGVEDMMLLRDAIHEAREAHELSAKRDSAMRRAMPWACATREDGEREPMAVEGIGG